METMTTARQYEPETMKKAEFVAKIFSEFPKEKTDRVLELANVLCLVETFFLDILLLQCYSWKKKGGSE